MIAVALTIAWRSSTAAERERYLRTALKTTDDAMLKARAWWQEIEPFRATLNARTRVAPVTPYLAAINVFMVVGMFIHVGARNDADVLLEWGASVGPRTANGEWWRLMTSLFLHASTFDLVMTLIALVPLALVLERLVGPMAFLAVYLTSGVFSSLFTVSAFPLVVSCGAAGAVAGSYAFMMAVSAWGVSQQPRLVMPSITVKWLAVCAAVFVAYTLATGIFATVVVGFVSGLFQGALVSRGVNLRATPAIRCTAIVAAMIAVAVSTAVPLRGITDVRRDIDVVVAMEERAATAFRIALVEFTEARMDDKKLAAVIDNSILPDLRRNRDRLQTIDVQTVPREQRHLSATATEYLTLREESWALRAAAVRGGKMAILRAADEKESASLQAFRRLKIAS